MIFILLFLFYIIIFFFFFFIAKAVAAERLWKIIERSSEEELKANGLQLKNSSELKSRETEDSPNSACDILENSLNESLELPSESSVVSEETSAQMHERCDNSVTQEKLGSSTEISGSKVGQQ